MQHRYLTQEEVRYYAYRCAEVIKYEHNTPTLNIYGHPRGGVTTSYLLSLFLADSYHITYVEYPNLCDIIVDDIYDTGKTAESLLCYDKPMYFLIDKRVDQIPEWVVFPWETKAKERTLAKIRREKTIRLEKTR